MVSVDLTDDEAKALVWAARRGARELRGEGWKDGVNNAEILEGASEKIEQASAGAS